MTAAAMTSSTAAQTAGFFPFMAFFTLSCTATSPKASGHTAAGRCRTAQATSARE